MLIKFSCEHTSHWKNNNPFRKEYIDCIGLVLSYEIVSKNKRVYNILYDSKVIDVNNKDYEIEILK